MRKINYIILVLITATLFSCIKDPMSEITDGMSLDHVEKIHLSKVLRSLGWNKSKASKVLGISRATLRAKIKKYSLSDNL